MPGMPAHGTLVLTDGLPLLGSEPDAFGLLQTPPLDLERVEVILWAPLAVRTFNLGVRAEL